MKPKFSLPKTARCIVRYADKDGNLREVGMTTPINNEGLFSIMLSKYHVGFGQIRAVKPDRTSPLTEKPQAFFMGPAFAH